jgi:hypothetical protein
MALSAHSIPVLISKALLLALEKRLSYAKLFNSDYEGEVKLGSAVKITSIGAIAVRPYTRYQKIEWQQVEDSSQSLLIDQSEYVAITIDDIDKIQSKPDVLAGYVVQAARDLKDVVDQHLASVLVGQAHPLTDELGDDALPLTITSENITSLFAHAARVLDDANVPREKRAAVLPNWCLEKLVLASIAEIKDNKAIAENGWIGRHSGFDLYITGNPQSGDTADEGGAGTADKIVFGSPISATLAVQLEKSEIVRLQDFFGSGYRSLAVWGARVIRDYTIAVATVDEGDESGS